MIGHVSGLPVEELLPTLISGGSAFLILRLTALRARLRPGRNANSPQLPPTRRSRRLRSFAARP